MFAEVRPALFALLTLPALGGCVVSTAAKVVTAPVRVASKGVDLATTSQSEADRNRGRELRHQEARLGRLQRAYERHSAQCLRGDEEACEQARLDYGELQNQRQAVPPRR